MQAQLREPGVFVHFPPGDAQPPLFVQAFVDVGAGHAVAVVAVLAGARARADRVRARRLRRAATVVRQAFVDVAADQPAPLVAWLAGAGTRADAVGASGLGRAAAVARGALVDVGTRNAVTSETGRDIVLGGGGAARDERERESGAGSETHCGNLSARAGRKKLGLPFSASEPRSRAR
jgi:hypothetical protein